MTSSLPTRLARRAGYESQRARRLLRDVPRWLQIARTPAAAGATSVFYGHDHVAGVDEVVHGGHVKFQALSASLPNEPRAFNLLYLGSSSMPLDAAMLVRLARRRGVPFLWNQNGVAYPGWAGDAYRRINRPRAQLLHAADYVFFQSAFCKLSSDRFQGERLGPWEVLHNPVDTTLFTPTRQATRRRPTLLLGGNQYARYRLVAALETLARLPKARLLVTGGLSWSAAAPREAAELVSAHGVAGRVDFLGPYTQREAPEIMRRADVLLHTKYNDPCPTVVLEAMACGVPVVYSDSGGTPELVGPDAGIGIPAPLDWLRDHPPEGSSLADAVRVVLDRPEDYRAAARARAERFDLRGWIERHLEVFEQVRSA